MKKMKALATFLVLMAAVNARAEMATGTITRSTRELVGGTVYTVDGNVTIPVESYENGLTVKMGGASFPDRVVIDIPEGCSLTVTGSDGDILAGGGAGIMLPANMTLYITGKGSLTATGGRAGNGGNGGNGGDAKFDDDNTNHFKNGEGGNGGGGGSGAGAGIGGSGGTGANRGNGGNQSKDWRYTGHGNNFPADGEDGKAGANGSDGGACGRVFILGDVTVTVRGGAAGAAGSAGTKYGERKEDIKTDDWHAGGGGPGGAGGGGGAAMSIGGGGGGAGGGGGGGAGSFVVVDNSDTFHPTKIYGGKGGSARGGATGGAGVTSEDEVKGEASESHDNYDEAQGHQTSKTGKGGDGGTGGKQGGAGSLYALPSVGLSLSPHRAVDGLLPDNLDNFLYVKATLDLGLKSAGGANATVTINQPFANAMTMIPDAEVGGYNPRIKRPGYRFAGFWTTREGDGTCVYGPDYKPTMVLCPYTKDYTLYARWEVDSSILSVTSSGDAASALDLYGNEAITLRNAVQALIDDPLLVGTDGRRRVTFEKLDASNRVVRLSSQIDIPTGVKSFEINGLCELEPGQKGVEIVAGPNSRHLNYAGKSSDGGMFSLANLNFTGGSYSSSVEPSYAGSIYLGGGASLSVDACSFMDNHAGGVVDGAVIALDAATDPSAVLLVTSSTFSGNSTPHYAGAVLMRRGYALFVNTTFSGNKAGTFGGAILEVGGAHIDMLNCTFAKNTAVRGASLHSADGNSVIRSVNCIFADNPTHWGCVSMSEGIYEGKKEFYWTSENVYSNNVFTAGGMAVTQVVAGVTHVIHPPRGGVDAGNEDAAEIYSDPSYENVRAVGRDGTEVVFAGNRDAAKIPFVVDQLQSVRTAPTRGAIRLAVGTEPVTVELDGVLYNSDGTPKDKQNVETAVTVSYSDGFTSTNMMIKTADYGVFGLSVPVDGSDGLSHNVTAVTVNKLGLEPIAVTMAPYAMTAASVELLGSNDYLPLYGDAIAIGNVAAGSISVTNSFDARAASSFTAGELKGFGEIDIEKVDISGGTLDWLGGAKPAANSDAFANLATMAIGGGADAESIGTISGSNVKAWQAKNDGFFQLQAQCQKPKDTTLRIELLAPGNVIAAEVTPQGTLGNEDGVRRYIWTVPVRKDDTVRMTMFTGELTLVKGQFIYFGVAE